jgi:hypothetical protein
MPRSAHFRIECCVRKFAPDLNPARLMACPRQPSIALFRSRIRTHSLGRGRVWSRRMRLRDFRRRCINSKDRIRSTSAAQVASVVSLDPSVPHRVKQNLTQS